jgi:hypothetical integral membrane protein (TIGR02206 family)
MGDFFAKDYTGGAFQLFGTAHLVALSVVILAIILLVIFGKRANENTRKIMRYSLAAILVVDEIGWHVWNAANGTWNIQTMLPLHLCSVFVVLSAYMLMTRSYTIYEFAYFLGIAGASQALLTPDAGIYGFPHYRFFQIILSHGCIIAAALYMTFVEGYRPTWNSLKKVLIGGNIYMVAVLFLNLAIGSNYLFIAHKPGTASAIDLMPAWPWYILVIELLAVGVSLLLYLPFLIKDKRDKKVMIEAAVE